MTHTVKTCDICGEERKYQGFNLHRMHCERKHQSEAGISVKKVKNTTTTPASFPFASIQEGIRRTAKIDTTITPEDKKIECPRCHVVGWGEKMNVRGTVTEYLCGMCSNSYVVHQDTGECRSGALFT